MCYSCDRMPLDSIIVGDLAVVAHGYVRATVDMDIVLHLERENTKSARRSSPESACSRKPSEFGIDRASARSRSRGIDRCTSGGQPIASIRSPRRALSIRFATPGTSVRSNQLPASGGLGDIIHAIFTRAGSRWTTRCDLMMSKANNVSVQGV